MTNFNIRRVNSEIRIIQKKIDSGNLPILTGYTFEIIQEFLEIVGPNFYTKLEIPKNYPFKPYYIGKPYYKSLVNLQEKIKNNDKNIYCFFFKCLYSIEPKMLSSDVCYCCSSVTCSYKWCPSFSFVKVIVEQLEVDFLETYSSAKKFNYLKNIYGLFEKFPIEIIDKIVDMNLIKNTELQD